MILASFQAYWTQELTAFTLDNYRDVFSRGLLRRAAANSFILGFFGAFVATALAVSIAYVAQRTRVPGRGLLDVLGTITVGIPGIVLGVALLWAWIKVPVAIYGTLWILLIAYVTRFLSFGVRNVSAALTQVGGELEAAARVAGATKRRAALTITLPLVKSNILASWVIFFISFIKELNTSVLLYSFSSVVLPVVIFDAYVEGHYQEVAALATGITAVVFLVLVTFSQLFKVSVTPRH
jgi:iron(III) transport system permease protein